MVENSLSQSQSKQHSLTKWQSEVWLDDHRYKVVNCGRRAGKSTLASIQMFTFAWNKPNSIVWYIAPTYRQAKDIMWQMLLQVIPAEGIRRKNETELRLDLINGSQIYLKGAEDPDKLRGVRIDLAVFDEVAFITRWDEAWKVIRPTLADSVADCIFISTPNGFNHFKDLSERKHKDWKYFHFTTYDNPYIPKEEVDDARNNMDEDSFAQEWLGEFRKMSGLIYKDFDRNVHMVDIPEIGGWTRARSIDFGYGHKTCCIWFAINSDGSQIYAYDGFYESGMTLDQIADAVRIKDGDSQITKSVGDSAQPLNIRELSDRGVIFNPVDKGADSVKMGIQKVASLLKIRHDTGKPTLMFNKDLEWIAHEMERYRWMENKTQGIIKEAPLKNEDDAVDAIRYFAMNYMKPLNQDIDFPSEDIFEKGGFY